MALSCIQIARIGPPILREWSVNRTGVRVRLLSGSHPRGVWFESSALRHPHI